MRGLDIGTGASAIYPILGAACFPLWTFVGTDVDKASLAYASTAVVGHANNGDSLSKRIALTPVDPDAAFLPPHDSAVGFEFTMCNPPFYTSYDEMEHSTNLKKTAASAVSPPLPFPPLLSLDRTESTDQTDVLLGVGMAGVSWYAVRDGGRWG